MTDSLDTQLIDIFVRKLPPGSCIVSDIQERQHFRNSPALVKLRSKAKKKILSLKRNPVV
jgi:hypothetical protein